MHDNHLMRFLRMAAYSFVHFQFLNFAFFIFFISSTYVIILKQLLTSGSMNTA